MGIAAYRRGNRVITRQIERDLGIPEPYEPKPEPRPPGWGDKAAARAIDHARRILAGAERYGMHAPTW